MTRTNLGPDHEHEFYYYLAPNEDGWRCCSCAYRPGEPQGFSPELDRSRIYTKVMGILLDLHNGDWVHVSNGSSGEAIESIVIARCRTERRFDQYSIGLFIFEAMTPSHAKYWKEVSDGIVVGKDPRPRCPCGKLATSYTWSDGKEQRRCNDCRGRELDGCPF